MTVRPTDVAEGGPDHELGSATAAGIGVCGWVLGKGRAPKLLLSVTDQIRHEKSPIILVGNPVTKCVFLQMQCFDEGIGDSLDKVGRVRGKIYPAKRKLS